ncbi:hypothetical protein K438DRAFT_1769827 [Mycena galopus ATCC 62051]|nr:hypothetical protein K438DRAFT_1769827 [Mycena galopus ATCC 62051]
MIIIIQSRPQHRRGRTSGTVGRQRVGRRGGRVRMWTRTRAATRRSACTHRMTGVRAGAGAGVAGYAYTGGSACRQSAARCRGGGKVKEGRGRGETGAEWVGAAACERMECVQATGTGLGGWTKLAFIQSSECLDDGSHPTFLVPAAVLIQRSQEGDSAWCALPFLRFRFLCRFVCADGAAASARGGARGVDADARPGTVYRGYVLRARGRGYDTMWRNRMHRSRGTNTHAEILAASKRHASVSTQTVQLGRASAVVVVTAAAVVRAVCRRARRWLLRRGNADAVRGQVAVVVCEGESEGASGRGGVGTRYVVCRRRRLTRARHESVLFSSILLRIRVGESKKEEEWGWRVKAERRTCVESCHWMSCYFVRDKVSGWCGCACAYACVLATEMGLGCAECLIWGRGGECTLAGFPKKAIGIWRVSRRQLCKSHSISPSEFPYPSAASLVDPGLVPRGRVHRICAPLQMARPLFSVMLGQLLAREQEGAARYLIAAPFEEAVRARALDAREPRCN